MTLIFRNCQFFFGLCRRKRATLDLKIGLPTKKNQTSLQSMDITLTNEQKVKVTLNPTTGGGRAAKIDGQPTWTVPSGGATLEVAEDGMSAFIISPDEPGTSVVLIEADADLGEGIETIQATLTIVVVGAKASNLGLTLGEPELK